ncbi:MULTISPECIES: zinc ribbon domain-containing protein [Paenibacillus]
MYCSNCGKQVLEGAKFCSSCGAKLLVSDEGRPIDTTDVEAPQVSITKLEEESLAQNGLAATRGTKAKIIQRALTLCLTSLLCIWSLDYSRLSVMMFGTARITHSF